MENVYCEFANWPSLSGSNVDDTNINKEFKIELDASQSFIKILSINNLRIKSIKIYTILGELLYYSSFIDNYNFTININNYSTGIYIIAINKQIYKFYILR
ncbi:MAG: T9SS type A sorting domain-containing protein [Bacteroidetes bacterium]|nr:MAG: T9SS type A sorting domain-containing protein [Bacteroidota bacterium]